MDATEFQEALIFPLGNTLIFC